MKSGSDTEKKSAPISVIVVDDDKDIVEVLSDFLELAKIKVLAKCYDGKLAVELYEKLRPDVVLLDIMMPDYDGFYALTKIRQIDNNAKILMVTADARKETTARLEQIEGLEVVYKPFDFNNVLEGISKLFEGHIDAMAYQGATYSIRPSTQI